MQSLHEQERYFGRVAVFSKSILMRFGLKNSNLERKHDGEGKK